MNDYSIPKPTLSPAAWALGAAVITGLIGLGAVAYHVFSMVDPWPVALAFAAVIEVGAVTECLSILRGNRWAIAGAVISLAVSGSYNVTRITRAGLDLPIAEAAALAIGPLSAVLFLALSLAHELHQHEAAIKGWEDARQAWQDKQAEKAAAREDRRAVKLAEIEARAASIPAGGSSTPASTPLPRSSRGTYQDFYELLRSNGRTPHTNAELAERFHVSTRTVTEWRRRFQDEHPTPTPTAERVN